MPVGFTDIFWLSWISEGNLNLNRSDLSSVFRVIIAKLFESTGKKAENTVPTPAEAQALHAACQDFVHIATFQPQLLQTKRAMMTASPPECGTPFQAH
jgi:hypothetical protein